VSKVGSLTMGWYTAKLRRSLESGGPFALDAMLANGGPLLINDHAVHVQSACVCVVRVQCICMCMCRVHSRAWERAWVSARVEGGGQRRGQFFIEGRGWGWRARARMQAHSITLPYAVQQGPDRTARGPGTKKPAPYTRPSCACRFRAAELSEAEASRVLARSSMRPPARPCQQRRVTPVGHACDTHAAQHGVLKRRRVRTACGARPETRWWSRRQLAVAPPPTGA
jgi:hypothetical protein